MLLMETMFICSLNDGDAEADDNMTDTAFERVDSINSRAKYGQFSRTVV